MILFSFPFRHQCIMLLNVVTWLALLNYWNMRLILTLRIVKERHR